MTRKHFIALAEQLKVVRQYFISEAEWLYHCQQVAAICASSNPTFDRRKFLQACGIL